MHNPTDRIIHTTAFVTPVVENWPEREIAQWVHPMKDRSDDPSHHERMLLPELHLTPLVQQRLWYVLSYLVVAVCYLSGSLQHVRCYNTENKMC